MIINLKPVIGSAKSAHQVVTVDDSLTGEVWREQVNVVVSKLTEPTRTVLKWRWFAKLDGVPGTLGRGTRAAMLLGPGFKNKNVAIDALISAVPRVDAASDSDDLSDATPSM